MIPGHQRVTILECIVEEKEEEASEMTKTKRGHVVRAQLLPSARDDKEDAYRDKHSTLVEWPHKECSGATEPGEKEVQGAALVPPSHQQEEQECNKKEARSVGEI
jgi:hypothetical protein